ncbi:MAG: O-antigen ligase family protein [Prevotellaceae bacterium]|jgi:O-antigen ligase|nr:O-antigen ligase family protein [Prevotellaceae bacterium]
MAILDKIGSIGIPPKGVIYLLFMAGLAAMVYGLITQQLMIFVVAACAPIGLIILLLGIDKPILSYTIFAIITCYFSAIYRYTSIEGLSIVIEILLYFTLFSIFLNIVATQDSYPWRNAANILSITYAIWMVYCLLSMLAPYNVIRDWTASGTRSVFFLSPLLYILSGILLCSPKKLRTTLILLSIFVITAGFKVYWQKSQGFDRYEAAWLSSGAWMTHLLKSGIRYFSFYSDAGNFGSSMGMFVLAFGIIASLAKKRFFRLFFLGVAVIAGVGMMMSGTRGAMIVPFGGMGLYLLLCRNAKLSIGISVMGILIYIFFAFTDIGEDNTFIKRMRTAFRPDEDASMNVRLGNQQRFAYYLKDKPFGVGIGGTIVDTDRLLGLEEDYIPTDSYFVGVWVENGVVGLCLYITILVVILLRCCYIIMFKVKNRQLSRILAALLCSVFGIWLNGYVGRGMGFQPSSFVIAIFLSFVLNGAYMDKRLAKDEIIL